MAAKKTKSSPTKKTAAKRSDKTVDSPNPGLADVLAQDPPNNPTPQSVKDAGESDPRVSAALPKEQQDLVKGIEPSRADTVLKDAGQWPTEAHAVTTGV